MKTIFGKELVKIRLDNGISLKDMAAGLGVPSSYLSAVESASETNHKKLTSDFLERIFGYLRLDETDEVRLRKAAAVSTGEYRINTSSLDEKRLDTLTMFAQKVGALPPGEIERIRDILKAK